MADVQISQQELDMLRGTRQLLGQLLDDPKEGLALKRKVKTILPAAKFPELDIVDAASAPLNEKLESIGKEFGDFKKSVEDERKANADRAAEQSLRDRLDGVKKQYSFTDEGMQEVIKRLKAQNSSDVEGAAAYVYGLQPKTEPVASSGLFPSKLNLFGSAEVSDDPKLKMLNSDPMHFLETEAIAVMDEFARGEAA